MPTIPLHNTEGSMPKLKITPDMLKNAANIECSCGGIIFEPAMVFKKISPILSPSGKEEILPIDVMVCKKCGRINRNLMQFDVLPDEVMDELPKIKPNKQ